MNGTSSPASSKVNQHCNPSVHDNADNQSSANAALDSSTDLPAFKNYKLSARRCSSLKLFLGTRPNGDKCSSSKQSKHNELTEQQYLLAQEKCIRSKYYDVNRELEECGPSYIDDYITPEMNYKEAKMSGHEANMWDKEDNISLYGTPKEEMMPGLVDSKGPSFMRNQIEALFQPSGTSCRARHSLTVNPFVSSQTTNCQ